MKWARFPKRTLKEESNQPRTKNQEPRTKNQYQDEEEQQEQEKEDYDTMLVRI